MNLKRFLTAIVVAVAVLPAAAQYEGTSVNDRIGHGTDSIQALTNLSLFQEYFKSNDYAEAYPTWKYLMENAPLAQVSVYTRGATMLESLVQTEPDVAKKKVYFEDLMNMYDQRIRLVKELNSFSSAKMQTSRGAILCRKAYDFYYFGHGVADDYSLDKAYNMFTEGVQLVNDDPSTEVEGFVLYGYFDASCAKFKNNPDFREQFLKDYILCKEVCEKMLAKANEAEDSVAAQKIVDQYDPTLLSVENTFAESRAADREQLIAIFTPKVEQKKTDFNYLSSVIDILASNECDDTDVYFKAARYAYDIKPTYTSAIGLAQLCAKQKKNAESITYYNKALNLSNNDKQKASIAMRIVYALTRSGQDGADTYLNMVTALDPSMAGKVDFYRAQRAAVNKNYSEALTFARRAASADPSISGQANRLSARIADVQRRQAEYNRNKAEYDSKVAEQKKLDDFWKGN